METKKRAAIVTVNGKINLDQKNIRSVDIASLRDMVFLLGSYSEVDYVSSKRKRFSATSSENVPHFKNFLDTCLHDYDHVYVYNFTANFFGGAVQHHVVKQLKELSGHKGKLFYIQTDPELHLKNLATIIYDAVAKGRKLTFEDDNRLTAVDAENFANLKWSLIYNGENVEEYLRSYRQKVTLTQRCSIVEHSYSKFFERKYASLNISPIRSRETHEREFDLVYYGNWRPERAKQLRHYFVNNGLKNYLIGIKSDHIKSEVGITFRDYMDHAHLSDEINRSWSSIVIGDPVHCSSQVKTARFFENIKSDVISFIDVNYDKERKLYQHPNLQNHLYVNSINELKTKLKKIQQRPELFHAILNLQRLELERYKHIQL